MNKVKLLSIAVATLIIINLFFVDFLLFRSPMNQPPPRGHHLREDGPKELIIERLGFDERQVQDYEKLIARHRFTVDSLDSEMRQVKNKLYMTLSNDGQTGRAELENQLFNLHSEIEKAHYQHFSDIRGICRPDQLRYFNALTEDLARFFSTDKKSRHPPKD